MSIRGSRDTTLRNAVVLFGQGPANELEQLAEGNSLTRSFYPSSRSVTRTLV